MFSLKNGDMPLVLLFTLLSIGLCFTPTGFEERIDARAVRCKAQVLNVDDSQVVLTGMIRHGQQGVTLKMLDGPYEGEVVNSTNLLMGRMDIDKLFAQGDMALAVITPDENNGMGMVVPQDHYRLDLEVFLLCLFAALLLIFGGWTGAKALLSFVFTGLVLWKALVPLMLRGYDPVLLSLGIVTLLTAAIIFLVAGFTRKGLSAFLGAFLGVASSCLLSIYFTDALRLHGAVMPFAETLLYSGYGHLDLTRIYSAAVFLAASGAVMDLGMDVSASLEEVTAENPNMTFFEAAKSGIRVGRAVVGTMTTTLLLAYSGGFVTLMMAFMAQGVPAANFFNMIFVAAEVLKTLVGSFGLVLVAPFTAVTGAWIFTRKRKIRVSDSSGVPRGSARFVRSPSEAG